MKKKTAKKSTASARVARRKSKLKPLPPFELSLEYSGGHWPDLDKLLRRLAKRLGAKDGGSGFSFMDGQRDIQLFFPDRTSRAEFQDALRSLSSIFVTLRDQAES